MQVIKRDGRIVEFNIDKIKKAITSAFIEVDIELTNESETIINNIIKHISSLDKQLEVEDIQDIIETMLMDDRKDVAKAYIRYRYKKEMIRQSNTTDKSIFELLSGESDYWNKENSNKNATLVTTQRDYIAGITSTDIARRFLIPNHIVKGHDEGIIHFHDMDYFAQNSLTNCELINLEDMLQNGTMINNVKIEKPKKILTASTIATQIITAVTSNTYGGATISLTHLAPFVRSSYEFYLDKYKNRGLNSDDTIKYAKEDLKSEIIASVQTFNYQISSMANTNGQSPFLSIFMYLGETNEYKEELAMLIEEFLNQRIIGIKNESGVFVTQAFPKMLYVLERDNVESDKPYFYLTKLALRCSVKRLVPDYISEKKMKLLKEGNCFPNMGCRSFLAPYYELGKPKFYGRFNCGVVTVNLVDIALSSNKDIDKFWEIFEERTELCHEALQCRYKKLKGTSSDVAPILWQNGALARLQKHETIDELLLNGYASISLGFAGLYECIKYMTNESQLEKNGFNFGIEVMKKLNEKCDKWKKDENLGYSLYSTPLESTTYKFAKSLKKRFGDDVFVKIDGKDRNYITNSYHIPVFQEINPFDKLAIESKFQELSLGGAISYVECADLTQNEDAVLNLIKFMYHNIMYAELNTKSDYCQICGYDGEIKIIDENNELLWECPNCKNRDQSKMNVARRTCGYIGNNFWNEGRTEEIKDRYVHLDNHIEEV
jgi:ribonucleoside-triphosphate reductase